MICIGNRKVYIYSIFQFTNTYTFIIHILTLQLPIKKYIKRRRNSEISKFSPSICVWKQIRIVLQWSVLLNIKRGTKTSEAIDDNMIAEIATGDRIIVPTKVAIATTDNTT